MTRLEVSAKADWKIYGVLDLINDVEKNAPSEDDLDAVLTKLFTHDGKQWLSLDAWNMCLALDQRVNGRGGGSGIRSMDVALFWELLASLDRTEVQSFMAVVRASEDEYWYQSISATVYCLM